MVRNYDTMVFYDPKAKRSDFNYFTSLPFRLVVMTFSVENFVAKPCSFRSLKKGLQNIRFVRRFSIMLIFHFILSARECKKNTANIQRKYICSNKEWKHFVHMYVDVVKYIKV